MDTTPAARSNRAMVGRAAARWGLRASAVLSVWLGPGVTWAADEAAPDRAIRVTLAPASPDVAVERYERATRTWRSACLGSCVTPLEADAPHRARIGDAPWQYFELSRAKGAHQRVVVRPPAPGAKSGAIVLAVLGGLTMAGGGAIVLRSLTVSPDAHGNLVMAGVGVLLAGAALVGLGVPMIVHTGRSRVDVERVERSPAPPRGVPLASTITLLGGTF